MTKQELEYVLCYTNQSIEECKLEYDDLNETSYSLEEQRENGEITESQYEDDYNDVRHKVWIIGEIIKRKYVQSLKK
jgi:hypothetical protein